MATAGLTGASFWSLSSTSSSDDSDYEGTCDNMSGSGEQSLLHSQRVVVKNIQSTLRDASKIQDDLKKSQKKHTRWKEKGEHRHRPRGKDNESRWKDVEDVCRHQEAEVDNIVHHLQAVIQLQKTAIQTFGRVARALQRTTHTPVDTVAGSSSEGDSLLESGTAKEIMGNGGMEDGSSPLCNISSNISVIQHNEGCLTKAEASYNRQLRRKQTTETEDNRVTFKFDLDDTQDSNSTCMEVVSGSNRGIQLLDNVDKLVEPDKRGGSRKTVSTLSPSQEQMTVANGATGSMLSSGPRHSANKNQGVGKKRKECLDCGGVIDQQHSSVKEGSGLLSTSPSSDTVVSNSLRDSLQEWSRLFRLGQRPDVTIPIEMWNEWATAEEVRAKDNTAVMVERPGIQTVFCLDISASMQGENWRFSKTYVTAFLDKAEANGSGEYFALVTFGHETHVSQHLTKDYNSIKKNLDGIQPGGPTTLYGGLTLCHGLIKGGGLQIVVGQAKLLVNPRVVLISDGKLSPSDVISGPDEISQFDVQREKCIVQRRAEFLAAEQSVKIFTIPVGDYDEEFLTLLAKVTDGVLLKTEQQQNQLIRSSGNYDIAGTMLTKDLLWLKDELMVRLENPDITDLDMQDINWFVNEYENLLQNLKDDKSINGYPNMMPVGSRVRRGPDWMGGDEDAYAVGTVIGLRTDGYTRVHWDAGMKKMYKYGSGSRFEIVVVDEPRKVKEGEPIQVGCMVQRGPDWQTGDEDGGVGSVGVVYRDTPFKIIKVRWSCGAHDVYKVGYFGEYEVKLCDISLESKGPTSGPATTARQREQRTEVLGRNKNSINGPRRQETLPAPLSVSTGETSTETQDRATVRFRPHKSSTSLTHTLSIEKGRRQTDIISSESSRPAGVSHLPYTLPEPVPASTSRQNTTVSQSGMDFVWQFKTKTGWKDYSIDICKTIEASYVQVPKGTAIFYMNGQPYKVLPEKMKAIHLPTNKAADIQRLSLN